MYNNNETIKKYKEETHLTHIAPNSQSPARYPVIYKAFFVNRPNRFVVQITLDDCLVKAHLPNPGRMWELLYPGVVLYVVPHGDDTKKTRYRVIGIERDNIPIMLDTNYSNDVAEWLVNEKKIPGWEAYHVVRREYTIGNSRFDLLLSDDADTQFLVEVKSCTLFGEKGAMFPDAITERGRKHLLELAKLQEEGWHTGVLLLVQWGRAQWFLPDYHTDLLFSQTFLEVAGILDWKALAVQWDTSFSTPDVKGLCSFDRELLQREAQDKGDYLIVLRLLEETELVIGSKGKIAFPAGYYVYVGSAKANLSKRISRHQRKRKNKHWHLDYFRNACEWIAAVPIRTSDDLECEIAREMKKIAEWEIPGFGSSDCTCSAHLFGLQENPIHYEPFMKLVEDFRMNRLDAMIIKDR